MTAFQLNKSQRRKLSIFLKCVLFSFLAWVLFAISSKYIYSKHVALEYINFPENRAFSALQPDSAVVKLEATGWQLLFTSLVQDDKSIQVDLSGLKNRSYISFANQIGFINRQFPNNQRVVSVSPDTLFFDFSAQNEKRVPVLIRHELTFAKRFGIIAESSTNPKNVTVRGPWEELAKLKYWETDTIRVKNINSTYRQIVNLNTGQHPNLRVRPKQVEVTIPIGEMTEKVIDIPIEVLNISPYRSVRVLPKTVRLTVLVSLVDYAALGPDQFQAVVDLKDWLDKEERTTLPVKLLKQPGFTRVIRIYPQNVDFFVIK